MKSTIRLISVFLLFAFVLQSCNLKQQRNPELQGALDQLVTENSVPGINFSIIYADGSQENYSSGLADTDTQLKLNENHVMFSGSIGKTYAVAVLMQLVEEGKVDLDKTFISYFPDTEWLLELPNIKDITVRMLLEHTSGLPRYIDNQGGLGFLTGKP